MPGIVGQKIGMTRIINEDGRSVPVTVISCQPNTITQVKNEEKDGYTAIVVGSFARPRPSKNKKFYKVAEFRVDSPEEYKVGDQIDASLFSEVASVTISAQSKGKGFQGVIKRHNFSRGPETHGSHHHREPGSIGACAMPGRVAKGKKLPGHMGVNRVTLKQVPVIMVDAKKNLIAVKGPIPGPKKGIVKLTIE